MTERRTAYEVAVQDRSTLHYYIGLIVRWKQQWKYKYARWLARKNGATIGEGVNMPISLAKKANKNLKIGNYTSIQTDKLDARSPLIIGNQVIIGGGVRKSLQLLITSIRQIGSTSITALQSTTTFGFQRKFSFCPAVATSVVGQSLAVAASSSKMSSRCLLSAAILPRSSKSVSAFTPTSSSRASSEETTKRTEKRGSDENDRKLNILMVSIPFYPHCGGLETATMNLSLELCRKGHRVKVITHTSSKEKDNFPFEVLRNPSIADVFKAYKWCNIFCHQQISLKYVWPIFLLRRPWFVVYHQVFYQKGILGEIKKMFSHLSYNIAVSKTTAKGYELKNPFVIYNTYNDKIFKTTNEAERRDFLFVGRMITGKGIYVLLEAFAKFKEKTGSDYKLMYIGDGPELEHIKEQAAGMRIKEDIIFLRRKTPEEICEIQNRCKVQVVPSTRPYYEAFGIVVLEALASGCVVIGSDGDGIEEALGNNKFTFANGDVEDLALKLEETAYLSEKECALYREGAKTWLETLTMEKIGMRYIEEFKSKINR